MSWNRILGHDELKASFQRVVARGRLAHAYLFLGPTGVGKRLFAQELGKALLCEAGQDVLAACDQCAACALVDAGTHPDLFAVQKPEDKNEIPIELMQQLCGSFGLKSARGRGKVAILDDADDLNEESANCFLKTLEEPPPRSVFILIGSSPERQLPTIRSRCQLVRFGTLPDETVAQILRQHDVTDPAQIGRLVHLAGGSPGQALALADDTLWEFRRKFLEALTRPKVDSFGLGRAYVEFAEDAGKEVAAQRRRAALALRLIIDALKDALTLSVGGTVKGDDVAILTPLTKRATTDKILALLERCLETETQLDRYLPLALVLEALPDALGQALEDAAPLAAHS